MPHASHYRAYVKPKRRLTFNKTSIIVIVDREFLGYTRCIERALDMAFTNPRDYELMAPNDLPS
jgi:hypothetical protein